MRFFANLKVTAKLALLLGVMLAGFAVIGTTYLNTAKVEKETTKTTQDLGRFHLSIEKIVQQLGETATYQRDFLLNRQLDDLEEFESSVADTRENLIDLDKQTNDAELQELISYVQESLDAYNTAVYQLAEIRISVGLDQGSGLLGDMRAASQGLETSLVALKDRTSFGRQALLNEKLMISLFTIHRNEAQYLQKEEFELAAPMIQEIANFIELLEASTFSVEQKTRLGDLLFTYHDRFNEVAETLKNVQLSQEEVNIAYDSIGPSVDALVDTIETITTESFNRFETQRIQSTRVFTITLVLTAVLVILLMFFLGRGITKPLGRLQATVQQVNQGDMTARARMQQRDEIGSLGRIFQLGDAI